MHILLSGILLAAQAAAPAVQRSDPPAVAAAKAVLADEKYVRPPEAIARLVTAPRHQNATLTDPSPDRKWMLREVSEGMPSVATFGRPHLYFAGLQVDPRANRSRALTNRVSIGLEVVNIATGESRKLETPAGATVSGMVWSPDGTEFAYLAHFDASTQLFVGDPVSGKSRPVVRTPLLATLVTGVEWSADSKGIYAVLIPEGRGAPPARPAVATGPKVRLWMDSLESSQRNWATLLEDEYDQDHMAYFVTGQLARIAVRAGTGGSVGTVARIGSPAMISDVEPSPDGRWLKVTRLERPFSYVVQYNGFAAVDEVWDLGGKIVATIARRPLREATDSTSASARVARDSSKRAVAWLPDGSGVHWIGATPRGAGADTADAGGGSGRRERVMVWRAPFGPSDTVVAYSSEGTISDAAFSRDAKLVFISRARQGTGEILAVRVGDTAASARKTIARLRNWAPRFVVMGVRPQGFGGFGQGTPGDSLTFYQQPGDLVLLGGRAGGREVLMSGDSAVFLSGTRYNRDWQTQGPRAFVDRVGIASGSKAHIYESGGDTSVDVELPLDADFSRAIIRRESATSFPNYYAVDMKSGTATQLTRNSDPMPEFTRLQRRNLWVTRADGVRFLVKLTLPADYQAGTRLPGMLWLYPFEYTSQSDYERSLRTEDINQFITGQPRTIEYLATQGYAVANFNPPIIGDQGRMNDSYVADLRMNLLAVIDELDKQGFVDRSRMGIGGHSYGAFATANAMVHTPFFKAGIAGDGMYNRTLTPNGFQSERRDLWSGQRTYLEMSPMLYAERLQGSLLMYHMMEDQNVGTDPISSIRMMQALRAQGKVASLYMYPYEDHGPLTSETVLDLWARWTAWLDLYVKNAAVGKLSS
jgi:dipeptidyl aminopeptidase/acylaminoacyl peptidase